MKAEPHGGKLKKYALRVFLKQVWVSTTMHKTPKQVAAISL